MSWFTGLEHVVREQVPLAPWNWLRLGGEAEFFAEPGSVEELAELLRKAHAANLQVRLLGAGSNILVSDTGAAGVVVHLSSSAFGNIAVNKNEIVAGGGARLSHLVSTAAREGLAGLESLVGIPGTVGGALRKNTIGHGAAIGQWAVGVTVMTREGETVALAGDDLRFSYRDSNLDKLVVLDATFQLETGDALKVTRQMQKLWIMKRAAQPTGELGHCQVFADPRGMTAGEIIDQAGVKTEMVGGASLNDRDPNFIEAAPGTKSDDVLKLIETIQKQVSERVGVELIPSIQVW